MAGTKKVADLVGYGLGARDWRFRHLLTRAAVVQHVAVGWDVGVGIWEGEHGMAKLEQTWPMETAPPAAAVRHPSGITAVQGSATAALGSLGVLYSKPVLTMD